MTITIIDNASGMQNTVDLAEYRQHGELPEDYGIPNNSDEVVWVNVGYARTDPDWDVPDGWPEHLPRWEHRP